MSDVVLLDGYYNDHFEVDGGDQDVVVAVGAPAGPTGATGATGPQGPAGADGSDGADGADGADGEIFTISEIDSTDSPYSASLNEQIIADPDGPISIVLPEPTTLGTVNIKADDPALGVAATLSNDITVTSVAAETIDREPSQTISLNRHNLKFRSTGTRWIIT